MPSRPTRTETRPTHEEYEALRAKGTRFAVMPHEDHVYPDVELVVERHDRCWVVEKIGVAARVAEEIDPRASQ
jgi:hypothetical protein